MVHIKHCSSGLCCSKLLSEAVPVAISACNPPCHLPTVLLQAWNVSLGALCFAALAACCIILAGRVYISYKQRKHWCAKDAHLHKPMHLLPNRLSLLSSRISGGKLQHAQL